MRLHFDELPADDQANRMAASARRALESWGIGNAKLALIKYRENAVFAVDTGATRYALRVHRHAYHGLAELRSELQWIAALGAASIDVPTIVPTEDGSLLASVPCDGLPEPVQVDLFEWIEGAQLGSVEAGVAGSDAQIRQNYATVGRLAARVHEQSAAWTPPDGFVRHAWDEEGLAGEQPFWGRFWELPSLQRDERELLERARSRMYRDLRALPKNRDRYSMIHADFAPENLLVDGTRVRLIDFDDAGFGWHLFELATSLYFIMGESYFELARDALIDAYCSERPLSDEDLEQLPLFFLARACTYVGWVHTRPGTDTARDLTPMLVDGACTLAESYLRS
ncbi:MAG TPA: phosphotransferase [Woeseiaceae bacterium]|nr:phosphotransferase [Woeseiaceae bacterium]